MSTVLIVLLSIIILGIISAIGYFAYTKLGKDTTKSGSTSSGSTSSGSGTRTTTSGTTSGSGTRTTSSGTGGSGLLNINVRNESTLGGSETTSSGGSRTTTTSGGSETTTTSGGSGTPPSTPPPPSPYKRVDCQTQDDPFQFCASPNSFINVCQGSKGTSSDTYVRNMQDCIKNNYGRINEKEYNDARDLLISEEPKYGDATGQWYIPPFIKNIDCEQENEPNRFCQEPNNFMDVCAVTSKFGLDGAYSDYARKLQNCLKNNSMTVGNYKDNYEKARQKLIAKDARYGDSNNKDWYIPPYMAGIDCTQESNPLRFCQEPNNFMDVCQGLNSVSDNGYADKLKTCIKDHFSRVGYDQKSRDNYEKARQKLIAKDSKYGNSSDKNWFIPPFMTNIDCSQVNEPLRFCQEPYEFIQSCSTFSNVSDVDLNFVRKLQDCALNHRDRITDSYRRARAMYIAKDADYGKRTSQKNIPNMHIATNYISLIQKMNINI